MFACVCVGLWVYVCVFVFFNQTYKQTNERTNQRTNEMNQVIYKQDKVSNR